MCMITRLGYTTDGRHHGPLSKGILRTLHQRLPKDQPDQRNSSESVRFSVMTVGNGLAATLCF